jgi:hypothetical protein
VLRLLAKAFEALKAIDFLPLESDNANRLARGLKRLVRIGRSLPGGTGDRAATLIFRDGGKRAGSSPATAPASAGTPARGVRARPAASARREIGILVSVAM